MTATAKKRAPAEPAAGFIPGIGDYVWVVFYRGDQYPDGSDRGGWETIELRVVSAGKMVVLDLDGTQPLPENGLERSSLSGLYYALSENVFASRVTAESAAAARTPPPQTRTAAAPWPVQK